jgi:transcriptional regulator with PAS, ATPase and Fis domain
MESEISTIAGAVHDSQGRRLLVQIDGALRSHPLPERGVLSVGRSPMCDIAIDHPQISRVHAQLELGPQIFVRDKSSENGTFVRGVRLESAPVGVGIGEAIQFATVLAFVNGGAGTPEPSAPSCDGAEDMIRAAAPTRLTVLILGETGAGKEVCAERIHALSRRAAAPLVKVNCAALSESLVEALLFGSEKGAYTGANADRAGFVEAAHTGTLFLDEVGELSLAVQAKLLRLLEDGAVTRVGGVQPRPVDVRFVAATNRQLEADVAVGRFRADLFYRLSAVTLRLPPLRDRVDFTELVSTVLRRAADEQQRRIPALTPSAMAALRAHPWPGNIRELRHVLDRALLRAGDTGLLGVEHLDFPEIIERAPTRSARSTPAPFIAANDVGGSRHSRLDEDIARLEHQRIIEALTRAGGHQGNAARALGISRGTLQARMDRFNIPRPRKPR